MMRMLKSKRFFWISLVVIGLVASACVANAQQGVAERVGGAFDSAGRGIKRGVQNAFSQAQDSVHAQEVISRVYSRLHWDKTLTGSTLELEVNEDGTAILRGAVPDEAAKQRAIILTRDTVGVVQVISELGVMSAPHLVPTAPVSSTTTTTTTTRRAVSP